MQAVAAFGGRAAAAIRGSVAGLGPSSLLQEAASRVAPGAGACAGQTRTIISVDVKGGNVDAAWRAVTRKVTENRLNVEWKRQARFVKPTEARKLAAAETENRLAKRSFKAKLRWIFRRKARGC